MRARGALAAAVGTLLLIPAMAMAAPPPPGAAISDNLEFVTRVAGAAGITEGKFDRVRGRNEDDRDRRQPPGPTEPAAQLEEHSR